MTQNINIMPDRIFSSFKDLTIASAGVVAIKIPDWFLQVNEALMQMDGFYKFGIFLITAYAIWYRHVKKEK